MVTFSPHQTTKATVHSPSATLIPSMPCQARHLHSIHFWLVSSSLLSPLNWASLLASVSCLSSLTTMVLSPIPTLYPHPTTLSSSYSHQVTLNSDSPAPSHPINPTCFPYSLSTTLCYRMLSTPIPCRLPCPWLCCVVAVGVNSQVPVVSVMPIMLLVL